MELLKQRYLQIAATLLCCVLIALVSACSPLSAPASAATSCGTGTTIYALTHDYYPKPMLEGSLEIICDAQSQVGAHVEAGIDAPRGLAFDKSGNFYVANFPGPGTTSGDPNSISKFDRSGLLTKQLTVPFCPTNMLVDTQDRLYIAIGRGSRDECGADTAQYLVAFDSGLSKPYRTFSSPQVRASTSFVPLIFEHKVMIATLHSSIEPGLSGVSSISRFGSLVSAPAISSDFGAFIIDPRKYREGAFSQFPWKEGDSVTSAPGAFSIAVDSSKRVYVACQSGVLVYQRSWREPVERLSISGRPISVVVGENDHLYVGVGDISGAGHGRIIEYALPGTVPIRTIDGLHGNPWIIGVHMAK